MQLTKMYSQAKQRISEVTLPALQQISQAKHRISQVALPALMHWSGLG